MSMTDEEYQSRMDKLTEELGHDMYEITDFPDDLFEESVRRQKEIPFPELGPTPLDTTQELRWRLYRKGVRDIDILPMEDGAGWRVYDRADGDILPWNMIKDVDAVIAHLGLKVEAQVAEA